MGKGCRGKLVKEFFSKKEKLKIFDFLEVDSLDELELSYSVFEELDDRLIFRKILKPVIIPEEQIEHSQELLEAL